ncbi:membrane protein [Verrucomicrobiota bacterium]|nr:membrane protein [Verrucomicrobiota bacterium]
MSNPAHPLSLPTIGGLFPTGLRALAGGLALLAAGSPHLARAQSIATNQGRVFSVLEENDMVVKTDRHYTQGLKISYLQADGDVPRVAARMLELVPSVAYQPNALKFGYQIGQSMFTPANIRTRAALPADRPYGGWLYTGLILQRRGETRGGTPVLENFAIDLGIVGPESLAEEAQTWVHELRGRPLPLGWRHQLRTEPGINLKYERSYLFRSSWTNRFAMDLIPRGGFSVGNVDTSLRFGGMFRAGWNLPGNFGLQTVDSLTTPEGGHPPGRVDWSRRLGVWAFVGTEGRLVGHNIFLDGNLYQSSQHVEKELLIGELRTGFAVQLGRCLLGFTQVFRTPEFRKQPEHDAYGSVFAQIVF